VSELSIKNSAQAAIPPADVTDAGSIPPHKWLVALAVMLGAFMQSLDISIINVALPHMQRSFGAKVDQIAWVVTSYLIAIGVVLPMTGWLAARIGRRLYFIASITSFMLASALCGAAQTLPQIIIARFIQGAAGAAMLPLAQAIMLETFPPYEHTLAMSTLSLGSVMAPVFGPTLGGWITMHWNWRWNFYINVPVSLVAAAMVYTFVHDPPHLRKGRDGEPIDYMGLIYITAAFGLFEFVISRGQHVGWFAAPWVRYCTALSVGSVVLLIFHELRFPHPIVDLRLLKIFSFALAAFLVPVYTALVFTVNVLNPLFIQEVLGYDAEKTGLLVSPRAVGLAIGLVVVGQVSRRGFDMRYYPAIGLLIAAYELWVMSHWHLDTSVQGLIWPIFVFGLAIGGTFSIITAAGMGDIPRERLGFASSLFNIMANLGSATGISLFSSILTVRHHMYQAQIPADALSHVVPGQGMDPAIVVGSPGAHAWLLAYNDVYRMLLYIAIIVAPCCLLLRRPGSAVSVEAAVE
jgi:MFS transporter, DHA2 family, multidrug resistance protein